MLRRTTAICRPAVVATLCFAQQLATVLHITGVVQNSPSLFLIMSIHVRDAHTEQAQELRRTLVSTIIIMLALICIMRTWRMRYGVDDSNSRRDLHRPRDQRLRAGGILIRVCCMGPLNGPSVRNRSRYCGGVVDSLSGTIGAWCVSSHRRRRGSDTVARVLGKRRQLALSTDWTEDAA